MSAEEIRRHIAESLSSIQDKVFLQALMVIIDDKKNIYHLSDLEREKVNEAKQQYMHGEVKSQEQLDQELDQWLDSELYGQNSAPAKG